MLHLVFFEPCIAGNTGAAIRLVAGTGATLHLVEPLGFEMDEPRLRRAGLDYHELAQVQVHPSWESLTAAVPGRMFAFTTTASTHHTAVTWQDGDALVFGPEPTGLDDRVLADPRITAQVRIPMIPGRRSMNLTNAAAVGLYEAWRQLGFPEGV